MQREKTKVLILYVLFVIILGMVLGKPVLINAEVVLEEAKPTKKKPTPYFSSAFFFGLFLIVI